MLTLSKIQGCLLKQVLAAYFSPSILYPFLTSFPTSALILFPKSCSKLQILAYL